jgi:DNA (cytosine-5)-methyltransferase 1
MPDNPTRVRFLSLFSGIEAASLAWEPLGWECVAVAEIEPFPCAVLSARYPRIPNLGDVTKIREKQIAALGRIDVVVGGFPCQDVSIAGKRRGFENADGSATRSGLFWDAIRLVHWAALHGGCRWVVLENVPGLFNSHEGRDFAGVVGALAGTRFSPPRDGWRNAGCAVGPAGMVEWSVLDAQFWGLAQRRKRVFLVADLGDWSHRPPVLLERESMLGNPPTREKARQGVAGGAEGGTRGSGITGPLDNRENAGGAGWGTDWMIDGGLTVSMALNAHPGGSRYDGESETFITPQLYSIMPQRAGTDYKARAVDVAQPLMGSGPVSGAQGGDVVTHTLKADGFDASEDGTGRGVPMVPAGSGVRRLTVTECERLQGFPDGFTAVPFRGKAAADGNRYKALGNSMAVPVMRWIGERIDEVTGHGKPRRGLFPELEEGA